MLSLWRPSKSWGHLPNELRIDVAERANVEARFKAPPHQSELN